MVFGQVGNFGGPSLISVGVIVLIVAIVLAYWVYTDASGRGNENPLLWAALVGGLTLFTLVGGIIAFIVYLLIRD